MPPTLAHLKGNPVPQDPRVRHPHYRTADQSHATYRINVATTHRWDTVGMATREEVHRLVDAVPDDRLDAVSEIMRVFDPDASLDQ